MNGGFIFTFLDLGDNAKQTQRGLIKEYKNKNNLDDKVELLDKIEAQNVEKFHNTFPINYNVNLELFFYSLYELLCKQIIRF